MTRMLVPLFLFLPLFSSVGCGGDDTLTVAQALDAIAPAMCKKSEICFPDEFAAAYPNGQSDCVSGVKSLLPADSSSKQSACSQTEVDTCVGDIDSMTCPLTGWPSSCSKCA